METLPANVLWLKLNELGRKGKKFAVLVDGMAEKGAVFFPEELCSEISYTTPYHTKNHSGNYEPVLKEWQIYPVPHFKYKTGFNRIQRYIGSGDTFLLNFTLPTQVKTNLNIQEIYQLSNAKYKILLNNNFVCFSPETFIRIEKNIVSSYPMKGTAVYQGPHTEYQILDNQKESAEHHTIVDLIRNDLSRVSENVKVEKFRFTERIKTNEKELIQVSSKITGELKPDWPSKLGNILSEILPAGSVTGAPKPKTIEIIRKIENYERGWYTGIFGIFDGENFDSAVLIRFIEIAENGLVFKSGGGITFMSNWEDEYNELIRKVYVPIA